MASYSGGEMVGAGTYWSFSSGKMVDLKEGGTLPENSGGRYWRVPFGIAFLLVVVLGGVYIVALPVVIIATAIYVAVVRLFGSLFLQMRKSVFFGWRPSEAYLSGRNKENKDGKESKDGKGNGSKA